MFLIPKINRDKKAKILGFLSLVFTQSDSESGFLKIVLRLDDLLEGLARIQKSCYIHSYCLLQ